MRASRFFTRGFFNRPRAQLQMYTKVIFHRVMKGLEMARKVINCADFPGATSACTLSIAGTDDEVMAVAVAHAKSAHGHDDSPQLREAIRSLMKEEAAAL